MLRSASLAALDLWRTCCSGALSRAVRTSLRVHEEHCGSSDDLANEAIEGVVVGELTLEDGRWTRFSWLNAHEKEDAPKLISC